MTEVGEVEPRAAPSLFDRWFEPTIFGVIAVNAVVTVWSLADREHEHVFEPIHQGLMLVFVAEIIIRFAQVNYSPREFVANKWNVFDLTLVIVGLLPMLIGFLPHTGVGVMGLRLIRIGRLARIMHSVRHASTLRVAHITHLFKE